MNIAIGIPAYNEEKTIGNIVKKVSKTVYYVNQNNNLKKKLITDLEKQLT